MSLSGLRLYIFVQVEVVHDILVQVEVVHEQPEILVFHDIVSRPELEEIKRLGNPLVRTYNFFI